MIGSGLTREQSNDLYLGVINDGGEANLRRLCLEDLFFLLTIACKRKDINKDWLYARCREVEKDPDGFLDLWAREHYKSTIITFGLTIQDILKDPNITVGIFSHTRPNAKGFLEQIKREFEQNTFLQTLFPEILYQNPKGEAPKWSLDSGILVKREQNPKEATVEAWGLVDGQPTGKHFSLLIYDDVVTKESVSTPEQIKKTTEALQLSYNLGAQGGKRRFIGTRYHANDTYRTIMDLGTVKSRVYPATHDGTMEGEPVLLTSEQLGVKRRDMGPYIYSCFPAEAPILMGDFTEKNISEISVGDFVVGYSLEVGKKAKLTKSKVLAVRKKKSAVIEARFESGRFVRCTPDHRWYTGRRGIDSGGTDTHMTYSPLGFGYGETKALISVYDPSNANYNPNPISSAWLSGFFDGEGSASGKCIHFHQTSEKNLPICEKLEAILEELNFDYGITERKREDHWQKGRDYFLKGGRAAIIRFLRICDPAKSKQIVELLYSAGTRNFGKKLRDRLIGITELGEEEVYNIQTETGNYISYGYATKNCQMLQDPVADKSQGFKNEWLRFYKTLGDIKHWNKYILVDPANAKKTTSDYTVMEIIALAPDNNYYLIDAIRDRLNLTQRTKKLFEFVRKYSPLNIGYEQYGMQADIEHIQYVQEQENFRFNITPLGGSMPKVDRIKRLIPIFEQSRFYMPEELYFVNYEGRRVDYVKTFIDHEYLSFPVCVHDDMLDCRARILDESLEIKFPKKKESEKNYTDAPNYSGFGWMG